MPALYEGLREGVPEREITRLMVKHAGLDLPDPTQTAPENWTAACVITGHLVAALRGQVEFWTADHSACLREGRTAVRRRGQIRTEEALADALEGGPVLHARRMRRAAKTGAWLTVLRYTVIKSHIRGQQYFHILIISLWWDKGSRICSILYRIIIYRILRVT